MTLHLYTTLKTWRRAKNERKDHGAATTLARSAGETRNETANSAVYAAGLACAGQVPEQANR